MTSSPRLQDVPRSRMWSPFGYPPPSISQQPCEGGQSCLPGGVCEGKRPRQCLSRRLPTPAGPTRRDRGPLQILPWTSVGSPRLLRGDCLPHSPSSRGLLVLGGSPRPPPARGQLSCPAAARTRRTALRTGGGGSPAWARPPPALHSARCQPGSGDDCSGLRGPARKRTRSAACCPPRPRGRPPNSAPPFCQQSLDCRTQLLGGLWGAGRTSPWLWLFQPRRTLAAELSLPCRPWPGPEATRPACSRRDRLYLMPPPLPSPLWPSLLRLMAAGNDLHLRHCRGRALGQLPPNPCRGDYPPRLPATAAATRRHHLSVIPAPQPGSGFSTPRPA